MRIFLAHALLVSLAAASTVAEVDPTEPRELRTPVCPESNLLAVEACASAVNVPAGDPCASCQANRDCPDGYVCSGPRSDLKCVLNGECVEEGCACNRKRDCCGQPNPGAGEADLRCRKPPVGHELYDPLQNNRMFCLPLDTWA
mmetsp:Transcript_18276/g.25754  ORF Transcript_18276/g.25754 Transcript_18276/m.25754 type:complete len:144 (-) Transcript_18276:250-681(-)